MLTSKSPEDSIATSCHTKHVKQRPRRSPNPATADNLPGKLQGVALVLSLSHPSWHW
jgi:hypothetical protein